MASVFLKASSMDQHQRLHCIAASSCNAGDVGLTPESRRSPGDEVATLSIILAWEIPWTEEPGLL